MSALVVLTTVNTSQQARKLTGLILKSKAAACVTVLPPAESHYRWKGRIEKARERVLLIKTRRSAYSRLEKILRANHPYSVPEIIALPVTKGSRAYLKWLAEQTSFRGEAEKSPH